jgi:uncharacterized protein (DUF433 family)
MSRPDEAEPRDLPTYGLLEAAQYLGVPASTLRVWSMGQGYPTRKGPRHAGALFPIAGKKPPTLSFWNLVELYVLASMRRQHGVSLQSVRRALRYVEQELSVARPLITQAFLTDGKDLFLQRYAKLVNVSAAGQLSIHMADSLARIEADPKGMAMRLYPWHLRPSEPKVVEIDPRRAFGRLVLTGTGIPTVSIAERFRAGESTGSLAQDYGLTQDQVEAAIRWEQRGAAA